MSFEMLYYGIITQKVMTRLITTMKIFKAGISICYISCSSVSSNKTKPHLKKNADVG
jgi:multisubunit Na+/H+ antiporter MnhC subunit